jgi:hypothetical protein
VLYGTLNTTHGISPFDLNPHPAVRSALSSITVLFTTVFEILIILVLSLLICFVLTRYYVNNYTQQTTWEKPMVPPYPLIAPSGSGPPPGYMDTHGPSAPGQQPLQQQSRFPQSTPDSSIPSGPQTPQGPQYSQQSLYGYPPRQQDGYSPVPNAYQQGLLPPTASKPTGGFMSKLSNKLPGGAGGGLLGVGAGILMGGFLEHEWDKHEDHEKNRYHHGGGLSGLAQSFGFSNRPHLQIHSANFGGLDVTERARNLIKPDQTLSLDTNCAYNVLSDPWPANLKSILILYQYGNRPLELLVAPERIGTVILDPDLPVDRNRTQFFTGDHHVIAVIWGIMQGRDTPVSADKVAEISRSGVFAATNDWMGFDGWVAVLKTCVVFVRHHDRIQCFSAREGSIGKLQ